MMINLMEPDIKFILTLGKLIDIEDNHVCETELVTQNHIFV